jgi:endoglucanase
LNDSFNRALNDSFKWPGRTADPLPLRAGPRLAMRAAMTKHALPPPLLVRPRGALGLALAVLALAPLAAHAAAPINLDGTGFRACGDAGLIDDGEDGNNQNIVGADRGGYWYTFRDKRGTTVEPAAGEDGGTFTMSPGGHASSFAARYRGKVATGAPLFAGMGMNFVDPKAAYDATKYAGIAFWARRAETSTGKVRLKIPDATTDPEGGVCTECFNDFGADINLTTDWKLYVFPWASLKQMPYWGSPRKPHIAPGKIYGVQFQVNVPSASYDISVDDLQFICK